jgi:hypothetical protein
MYLIFPELRRHPWLSALFLVVVAVSYFFRGDASDGVVYSELLTAAIVGGATLIGAGIGYAGMTEAANKQAQAAKDVAKLQADAARAAANTPLAKARERMAIAALNRFEDDEYLGLSAAQKREVMRRALYGYDAMTRGIETDLRRTIGMSGGFGRSGEIQEAVADMNENKKDVAAKTASSAEALSAQIKQGKKSQDLAIGTGAPDTSAQMFRELGAAQAQQAHQLGQIGAQEAAGKAALLRQGIGFAATFSPGSMPTPWYAENYGSETPTQTAGQTYGTYSGGYAPAPAIGVTNPMYGFNIPPTT